MKFGYKVGQTCKNLVTKGIITARTLRYFFYLQKTQWFSRKQLKKIQNRRLQLLLRHAYNTVPYYHKLFKMRRLRPQDVKTVEDLAKIPIIKREDVRNNFRNLVSRTFKKYGPILNSTSGSTGEPLRYYLDRENTIIANAARRRGWGYGGYRPRDKMAVLAGLSLVPQKQSTWNKAITKTIHRTIRLPAINMRKEVLGQYAKEIAKFKPKLIRGYPSSLYFFADFLKEEGIDYIRPKAIVTTAEMLLPYQRKLLKEIFHCEVFNEYGAFDGGIQAFECEEHSGLHIAMERTILDVVDQNGKPVTGEAGRIIATDLYNYAMPFIRYDVGDVGVLSDETCQCGRGLFLIKEILGRTTDILRFKNGTVLSGPSLTLIFRKFDIKQYQIIQESEDKLSIKLIKGRTYSEGDTMKLHTILREYIGEGINIHFDFVRYIPTTKSGKWKFILSEL